MLAPTCKNRPKAQNLGLVLNPKQKHTNQCNVGLACAQPTAAPCISLGTEVAGRKAHTSHTHNNTQERNAYPCTSCSSLLLLPLHPARAASPWGLVHRCTKHSPKRASPSDSNRAALQAQAMRVAHHAALPLCLAAYARHIHDKRPCCAQHIHTNNSPSPPYETKTARFKFLIISTITIVFNYKI